MGVIKAKVYNKVQPEYMATDNIDLVMRLLRDNTPPGKLMAIRKLLEKIAISNFNLGVLSVANDYNEFSEMHLFKIDSIGLDLDKLEKMESEINGD